VGKIFAIVNQKGGVGKTTTAINLGAACAALEMRVLLVDCDPQGNATRGVGLDAEAPHLYHLLIGQPGADPADAIVRSDFPHLDVLPAGRDLVGIEVEFVGMDGWLTRLREIVEQVRDRYDLILLDCPPSLGHLTIAALTASDGVLVPVQCEYFALEGISALVETIERVRGHHPTLELSGIIVTMYDDRTNLSRDVAGELVRVFPDQVFESFIPRNVRLAEAPSHGMPILQYDLASRGAQAYLKLARELAERVRSSATEEVLA